jgi:hypothetical protein
VVFFAAKDAALIVSLHLSSDALKAITTEYTYNMFGPFSWISALIILAVGAVLVLSTSSKARVALLNLLMFLLFVHLILVIIYGSQMCNSFRNLYLLHAELWEAFMDETFAPVLGKVLNNPRVHEHVGGGSHLHEIFEQASAGVIYSLSPYPLNMIFYLGIRIDLAAFLFVILPGVFILFSIPIIMTIRNYFASKKSC